MENRTARLTILIDPRKKALFDEICALGAQAWMTGARTRWYLNSAAWSASSNPYAKTTQTFYSATTSSFMPTTCSPFPSAATSFNLPPNYAPARA